MSPGSPLTRMPRRRLPAPPSFGKFGASRTSSIARAHPSRYQEARPDRLCRAPHHRAISWRGQPPSRHRLGVRPRLHRRCLARRFRPSHARPAQGERVAFLEAAIAYYASLGIEVRACDDRQRLVLPVKGFPGSLQASRSAPDLHQALYSQDQRESRALHSDKLARMGLCSRLQHFRRTHRRAAAMASPLQLA